jgi:hypothetical protein
VVVCQDKQSGLKAIIAIHDTTLGPALGGTRMWTYATDTVIKSIGRMIARFGSRIKAVKSMISPSADKKSSKTGVCQTVPIKYMVINAVRDATKTLFKSGMLLASFI